MTAVQANSGRATGKKVMRKLEKQGQAQVVNNFNAASGSKEQRKKHGMNHCNSQQTDLNSSHHMSHSNQATALSVSQKTTPLSMTQKTHIMLTLSSPIMHLEFDHFLMHRHDCQQEAVWVLMIHW